tara:strand:+ start:123 stop:881 length:759 start_codon:yes stop_codon:yes gene_type:complete
MENNFRLDGQIAVVTGCSGGIGESISKTFIDYGAKVYGFDIKSNNLNKYSENFNFIKCDLLDFNLFKNKCLKIFSKESKIDILINNAGITIPKKNSMYDLKDWRRTLDINLTIPFMCSQIAFELMKKNNAGSIVNITSLAAELGFPDNPAYGASKGGLKALSKANASEWGKFGVRVNCIGPGYIGEGMTKKSYDNNLTKKHRESMMMIKKWNTSKDVANACVFLCSKASIYITSQDIYVDGGWVSKGFPDTL